MMHNGAFHFLPWQLELIGLGLGTMLGVIAWAWLDNRRAHREMYRNQAQLGENLRADHVSLMAKLHDVHADLLKMLNSKADK